MDVQAEEYDVIIVGAGNAGCVLAARLSEDSSLQVLLIEAGNDHVGTFNGQVPTRGASLWDDGNINWKYMTVPQERFAGRSIDHPRGKGLGGSTLINLNCIVYPDRASIDNWGELGNEGWSWDAMKQYYRKFQTLHAPNTEIRDILGLQHIDGDQNGERGPIHVSFGRFTYPHAEAWSKTFRNLGHEAAGGLLSGETRGAIYAPASVNPAKSARSHAAEGYLTEEVKSRHNLTVKTEMFVTRVVLNAQSCPVATGVECRDREGLPYVVKSRRETIICCGAFKSPQLLELSGIGQKDLLAKLGISLAVDLPGVGENLQDHANVAMSFESAIPTFDSFRDPVVLQQAIEQYNESGAGPLSSSVYCQAFMPCIVNTADVEQAVDELMKKHMTSSSLAKQHSLIQRTIKTPRLPSAQFMMAPSKLRPGQSSSTLSKAAQAADFITLYASLSHPFSRGTCHITCVDPEVNSAVDPRYFSHPADIELEAAHLQYFETIVSTEPLKGLLKPNGMRIPEGFDLNALDDAKKLIKTGFTTYHPCGTCAMMRREDGGVVDERMRVFGVRGLRVVDASIFPIIPSGNIQSTVYAVAERAADIIKQDLAS